MEIDSHINNALNEIDDETKLEIEIKEKSIELAKRLYGGNVQRIWIKGKEYTISYKRSESELQIVLLDHMRLSIAGTKYKPAIFNLTLDENFSEIENLEKLIQTIYYYKYDMIQMDDIIEEDDSVWQIQKQ